LRAAAELGWSGLNAPVQYDAGQKQMQRNLARKAMEQA
jgi:hypothetical protein